MKQLGLLALMLGLALGVTACGGTESGGGGQGSAGGEAAYAGPIGSTDTAAGQAVFETYCSGCHPGGAEGRGPTLLDIHETPAQARQQLREGGDHMPAFPESRISATDLEDLLAYLTTLGSVDDGGATETTVVADPIPDPDVHTSGL